MKQAIFLENIYLTRDYFKTKKFKWSKKLISSKKNIFIYETTKQIAQIKTAANLIHEISKKKSNIQNCNNFT